MIRGTHRAAVLVCVVAVCWSCWTLPAAAQVATLSWSVPRGCPDTLYVEQRLAALALGEIRRRDLRVRARVQRVGRARYLLRLELRASDYHAERRLESTQCTSVADAAIWLIAMALDPNLSAGQGSVAALPTEPAGAAHTGPLTPPAETVAAETSAQAVRPAASATPGVAGAAATRPPVAAGAEPSRALPRTTSGSAPTTVPAAQQPPASTVRVSPAPSSAPGRSDRAALPRWGRAGVFGGVWSAGLPAPQASVGARAGFGLGVLYAELRGAAELSRGRRLSDGAGAHFATQDVGLALCSQWGDRLRGGPCATAALLRSTGGTRGASDAHDRALFWGAAGVSLELGFRLFGRLEIMFETGVQLPISARPRFTLDGLGEVAVAAPVNVYARVGLGFRSTDAVRER